MLVITEVPLRKPDFHNRSIRLPPGSIPKEFPQGFSEHKKAETEVSAFL